jgi:hypothetical protein
MLKTHQAKGKRTEPTGKHTQHLHSGMFGHKLNSDLEKSKHAKYVLEENGLIVVPLLELHLYDLGTVLTALQKYGPIMILGDFYKVLSIGLGHYIVLAGVDTDKKTLKIHDPAKLNPKWISADLINSSALNNNSSQFAIDPAAS